MHISSKMCKKSRPMGVFLCKACAKRPLFSCTPVGCATSLIRAQKRGPQTPFETQSYTPCSAFVTKLLKNPKIAPIWLKYLHKPFSIQKNTPSLHCDFFIVFDFKVSK
jgi:hypothetical protein